MSPRVGRDVNANVWHALASRLGLELPGMLPVAAIERLVAAEIRRRKWKLGQHATITPHATRACSEPGCREPDCMHAAKAQTGPVKIGRLPTLRLPGWRRS